MDLGAAAGAVHSQQRLDPAVPGRRARRRTTPAHRDCPVGPLHAFGQGACAAQAGDGGVAYQPEEASLSLHRVHLCRIAQHALRTTGVVCGL